MASVFDRIWEGVAELEIIDTHEHLPGFEHDRNADTDVLQEYLSHYFSRDLISAGLHPDDFSVVIDHHQPLEQRWALVSPYWKQARLTGYGRCLDISVKGLYGIDGICDETIGEVAEAFRSSLRPGHFHWVLQTKSKIKASLLDRTLHCDPTLFRGVFRLDTFVNPRSGQDIQQMEKQYGVSIVSFSDWLEVCEAALLKALADGAAALKSGLAYERSLEYEPVTYARAEAEFHELIRLKRTPDWSNCFFQPGKPFQDYMMHHVLRLANQRQLVFQFHTGLQEGSGNLIYHSEPSLLSNLFLQYPDVSFDLFHIGYPYQHVLSALAKNFRNVYIDMCWAHIISPTASINALIEWIDSVPLNKISGFGGDYLFVDAVYGHQYMARMNITRALAAKVAEGLFDVDEALEIAKQILFDNPQRLFGIDD